MRETPNQISNTEDFEFAALQAARNYRAALIAEFSSALHGQVLEVGAGIGQMTESLAALPGIQRLVSVEPDASFCRIFRQNLPGRPLVEGTVNELPEQTGWDAIFSVNVLEHIRDDELELSRYSRMLGARRGCVCLFVPARPELYAPIDRDFGHHRRYVRAELRGKLERAGFEVIRLHYFNLIGYFAWWWNFRLLARRHFTIGSVTVFDRAVFPWFHALERHVIRPPFGQSLLATARAGR